jgi:hypothetical protein
LPVSASPARPDYHATSPRPGKTGHFYFAENRTFLLCVDKALGMSNDKLHVGPRAVAIRAQAAHTLYRSGQTLVAIRGCDKIGVQTALKRDRSASCHAYSGCTHSDASESALAYPKSNLQF